MNSFARAPLPWLCGLLVLATVPLWEQAPFWTPLLVLLCAAGRSLAHLRRQPILAAPWRYALLLVAAGGILWRSRTFFGVEPGFGILLVLVSLKMLETRRGRDFMVLILLGYFLALCALFFSQELPRWLYVAALVLLLTGEAIHFQLAGERGALFRALRLAGVLTGQALLPAALLFLFLPRPAFDYRLFPGFIRQGQAAMSDFMSPGSIANMAQQSGRAFRASFPGLTSFPPPPYYWRGLVLWDGNGLEWQRGGRLSIEPRQLSAHGPAVQQHITLEPHGARWLFALDRPVSRLKEATYEPGGVLRSYKNIDQFFTYEVISQPENEERTLLPDQLAAATRLTGRISAEVRALADSFRAGAVPDAEVVQRGLDYFRQGNFTYSYAPGSYSSTEIDEFLFRRRTGFCEHYAGAFATLMRLAGIPSRVVLGYLGGEESHYGHYLIVNQSDAHAWCEVWLAGRGWVRLDPTSAAAPDRANSGLYNYLAAQRALAPAADPGGLGSWYASGTLRELRLLWDSVSYQWDSHVLTFNRENQQDFLALLGLGLWQPGELFGAVGAAFLVLLALLALWLRRPGVAAHDPARRLYLRFCRKVAAAGLLRAPAEGPLAFTHRAAERFPAQAEPLRRFGELYTASRYGPHPPPQPELLQAYRALPRLRAPRPNSPPSTRPP